MRTVLPHEVLTDLIREDRPSWVRRTIAEDLLSSDPSMRESLLSDVDPEIRWLTLKHSVGSLDEPLTALLADLAASREARLCFRTDGITARRNWQHTATEYDHQTLCLIASHPATPYATLQTLMAGSSVEVLANLIENPSIGPADCAPLVQSLQTSKSVAARELLASLRSAPGTALIELVSDKDVKVRAAVAQHLDAPLVALSRLAAGDDRTVRLAVLQNGSSDIWWG